MPPPTKHDRLGDRFLVRPGQKLELARVDPAETFGYERSTAGPKVAADLARLGDLQERLWAEQRRRVLIVLQGIDTAGKDGAIKHLANAFDPQGVRVVSFGVPTEVELAHDYLWRIHHHTPANGEIVIFNRSHYESVLVVRVRGLEPEAVWSRRYDHINAFERMLADEGTTILKFFLFIDRDEQRERLQARLDEPAKRWKFRVEDLAERERWDDYMAAFEAALRRCSTDHAPWFAIPANRKWFRDLAIGEIVADELERLEPAFPEPEDLPKNLVVR